MISEEDRYAIIFANEFYSDQYIGMIDLPEVNDDFNNIFQTVNMMQIPEENIYAYKNVKHE